MKITHCKLNKSIQNKLLEFFVLEVTARAAAYLLGIHANSAILFFRKIPKVITYPSKQMRFLMWANFTTNESIIPNYLRWNKTT